MYIHDIVFWQAFIITMSGERLTTRLRVQLFKALVHQTVGWHDEEEHTTGSLTAMLYVDTNNVKKVNSTITAKLFSLKCYILCGCTVITMASSIDP